MAWRSRSGPRARLSSPASACAPDWSGLERTVTYALAGSFLATALVCAVAVPAETSLSLPLALSLIGMYALVSQIELEIGRGSAVPTLLVFVPMLFLLPPGAVPLCVAAGLVAGGLAGRVRADPQTERLAVLLSSAWHSVGSAVS